MKFLSNRMVRQVTSALTGAKADLDILQEALTGAICDIYIATETISAQAEVIASQERDIMQLKLEYTRWGRDIIENFLIGLDNPEDEDELREFLEKAHIDLSDEVARIEEYA